MSQQIRIVEAQIGTTAHGIRTPFVYGKGVHSSGGSSEGMDVRVVVEDPQAVLDEVIGDIDEAFS